MKSLYLITLLLCSNAYAQCFDTYGAEVDCPTLNDSLVIYNNSLKVNDYYKNNTIYIQTRSRELVTSDDKKDVFDLLQQARKMFFVIRRTVAKMEPDKFRVGETSKKYKDITYEQYYSSIDEYRFYQRELENQIVNINAPQPIYDSRIAPILINEYKCSDSSSAYFGDLVNIPLYIPVVVKPFSLLSSTEIIERNEILNITITLSKSEIITKTIKESLTIQSYYESSHLPIYYENTLIGFLAGRSFLKIKPSEYQYYAVKKIGQILLEDEERLNKFLKIKFGDYIYTMKKPSEIKGL